MAGSSDAASKWNRWKSRAQKATARLWIGIEMLASPIAARPEAEPPRPEPKPDVARVRVVSERPLVSDPAQMRAFRKLVERGDFDTLPIWVPPLGNDKDGPEEEAPDLPSPAETQLGIRQGRATGPLDGSQMGSAPAVREFWLKDKPWLPVPPPIADYILNNGRPEMLAVHRFRGGTERAGDLKTPLESTSKMLKESKRLFTDNHRLTTDSMSSFQDDVKALGLRPEAQAGIDAKFGDARRALNDAFGTPSELLFRGMQQHVISGPLAELVAAVAEAAATTAMSDLEDQVTKTLAGENVKDPPRMAPVKLTLADNFSSLAKGRSVDRGQLERGALGHERSGPDMHL
jgi:hypothetical protein